MQVVGTATMGGTNSTDAAVGPDGLLYVINTGDYVGQGSLTIVNPATMAVVTTDSEHGRRTGRDQHRRERTRVHLELLLRHDRVEHGDAGVRSRPGQSDLRQACRRAAAAAPRRRRRTPAGNVYQIFFGSPSQSLPPYVFVFKAGTLRAERQHFGRRRADRHQH